MFIKRILLMAFFLIFFPFSSIYASNCQEELKKLSIVSSKMIYAEELKDFSKPNEPQIIFNPNLDGLFLKKNKKSLNIMLLKPDGTVEELRHIELPIIENKEFFDASFINERFIDLSYGELLKSSSFSFSEDTNRTNNYYTKIEHLIWDREKNDYFKIDNPDFISCHRIGHTNNPERLLVHETSYKVNGLNQYQSRYRYYNLLTRSFLDKPVLDFQPTSVVLMDPKTDDEGRYHFKYARILSHSSSRDDLIEVIENGDGTLSLGKIVYSNNSLNSFYSLEDEDLLIVNKTGGDGLQIPYIVDLKRKNPSERPLLTEDQVDELFSDIYEVSIVGGLLFYKTHFEKSKVHTRIIHELNEKGNFFQSLYSFEQQRSLQIQNKHPLFWKNIPIELDISKQIKELIKEYPNAFSPKEYEILNRLLSNNFINYLASLIKEEPLYKKLKGENSAIVDTADLRFKMPIYYTLPEQYRADGWFIINIHGGPHSREFNELDIEQQFWTSRGYPHLRLNIRGSTGFGKNYETASDGNWYGVVEDIQKAIQWAISQGFGTRAIIMGGSFGGYAAAAAYAKGYADVAFTGNGIFDLNTEMEAIAAGKTCHDKEISLSHFGNNPEIRKANSITTHLTSRPGAKMLIIVGLKDNNCLPEQSLSLYQQMVGLGNHVELVTMAEEGHTTTKFENTLMILRVMEQFLGDITGYSYEPNGYKTLLTTPNVSYQRSMGK